MNWMVLAAFFLFSAVIAGLSISALLPVLRRRQIVDQPNERSSHVVPTPRGAGLALIPIVAVFWIALGWGQATTQALIWPALAALFLCALSWFDDLKGLPPLTRFCAHILVVAVLLYFQRSDFLYARGLLPLWVDRLLAGFIWVWFINLFNFMDGIDGISGVETLSIGGGAVALAVMAPQIDFLSPPAAVLTGAAVGFIFLNWHPAKIFLGDSGSIPFGFMLGWLLLQLAAQGYWAAALILPLYYLADATITILSRLARREKIWQAHRQHFYQRAVAGGATHAQVSTMILVANILLIILAIVSLSHPWEALVAACAVTAILLVLLQRRAAQA